MSIAAVKVFQELIDTLENAKYRAELAVMVNPAMWWAVHGVSLNEYKAKANEAQQACRDAIRDIISRNPMEEKSTISNLEIG